MKVFFASDFKTFETYKAKANGDFSFILFGTNCRYTKRTLMLDINKAVPASRYARILLR